jgi:hypothetical protein
MGSSAMEGSYLRRCPLRVIRAVFSLVTGRDVGFAPARDGKSRHRTVGPEQPHDLVDQIA